MSDANNLFMQIEGITGCVSDKKYNGWIALDYANNGVFSSATINNGTGQMNSDGVRFEQVSFAKEMDATSTELMNMVAEGTNIKKIIVAMNVKTDNKDNEMVRWTYKNCILTCHQISANKVGGIPHEVMCFVFGSVECETQMVSPGGETKKYGPVGWNIIENTKL
ncbi:Hcp family type VI secretion system effector [Rahnella aquatilis]|uniref:Hcp family type VI secretion system effector n=1 Tax=Rahnella aquatilis TaxID=34038 RepID=UPI000648A575|nr:type VI secretion system tube protein Hcp [Rahnella aquatilis]